MKLLVFWIIFMAFFLTQERLFDLNYHLVHCAIDDKIPFCEYFLIPYLIWFVYIVWGHIYSLLFDVDLFRKFMWFIIVSFAITTVVYFIYPTYQDLRPTEFTKDTLMIRFMKFVYDIDTPTNVCPSLHVIASVAVLLEMWNSKHFSTVVWRIVFSVITVLICASTVFIKQHSFVDIIAGLGVCIVTYPIVYLICRKKP